MKSFVGAALALAFLTGPSLAQSAPPAPTPAAPAPPDAAAPGAATPSPPPPPDGRGGRDRDAQRLADARMWHHPMGPRSKAARFRIETGDMHLGIKCPEDEPMKACADFALQLVDKIGSMSQR